MLALKGHSCVSFPLKRLWTVGEDVVDSGLLATTKGAGQLELPFRCDLLRLSGVGTSVSEPILKRKTSVPASKEAALKHYFESILQFHYL